MHLSRRTLIEWALSLGGAAIAAIVILAMDTRVRIYGAQAFSDGDTGLHVPQMASRLIRLVLDLCRDHQPLAVFVGVAVLLVFFMRQMR